MRAWRFGVFAALLCAMLLALAGCGKDSSPPGLSPPPPVNPVVVDALVGPEGGTLSHPAGAKIVVPPGALTAPAHLTLAGIAPPGADVLGSEPLAQAFQAGPEGQVFLKPVDVFVPFDPTRLAAGTDANGVQVRMAPHGSTSFVALQSAVDLAARTVRARTVHFTDFVPAADAHPVFITSDPNLPQGTVGAPYAAQLAAQGGTGPYTWSVAGPPDGLVLSSAGAFSGTPSAPGASSFFVNATDATQHAVAMVVTLVVTAPTNPVPVLNQIAPTSAVQGSPAQPITLLGAGFVSTSQALFDGTALPTTFRDAATLSATIPASALVNFGNHTVSVTSPAPGGGTSASLAFTVTPSAQNPVPTITAVSPAQLPTSQTDAPIAITGTSFISTSTAVIGSQAIPTTYVSATQLDATIPASFLAVAGTLQIGVRNPPPGGGDSATTVPVVVAAPNPVPTLTSLSPTSVVAGSSDFTLTATGTNFVSGGRVFFGTTALATTVANATSASATVPASLVAAPGSAMVTFVNPAPGGGTSAALSFPIVTAADGGTDAGCGPCVPTNPCHVGALSCSDAAPSCDDTGVPVADGTACGAGSVCIAGSCASCGGSMAPGLTTLATSTRPQYVALDTCNVYWTDEETGGVMRVPKAGGNAVRIASASPAPNVGAVVASEAIVADANNVYWVEVVWGQGQGTGAPWVHNVLKTTRTDNVTTNIWSSSTNRPGPLAVDSTYVYVMHSAGVDRIPIGGGAATTLAALPNGGTGLAVSGTAAFWIGTSSDKDSVFTVPLGGGSVSKIATGAAAANFGFGAAIATDATNLYWVEMVPVGGYVRSAAIYRIPLNGGPQTTLVSNAVLLPNYLAQDDAYLYTTDNNLGVVQVAKSDGTITTLAPGQNTIGIAADDGFVYWVNGAYQSGPQSVMRIAKSQGQPNPVPTLASVSPTVLPVSSVDAQITISGTDFVPSTAVRIGAQAIPTTYVSSTQLTAMIPASYVSTAGTLTVGLFNPPPGGGPSATTIPITVANPSPTVTSLSPAIVAPGSASFVLTVTGTGFVQSGSIYFGSTALTTTVTSSTSATANVPAALVAAPASVPVTFVNPGPGGGTSGAIPFTIAAGTGLSCTATISGVSYSVDLELKIRSGVFSGGTMARYYLYLVPINPPTAWCGLPYLESVIVSIPPTTDFGFHDPYNMTNASAATTGIPINPDGTIGAAPGAVAGTGTMSGTSSGCPGTSWVCTGSTAILSCDGATASCGTP